MAGRRKKGWRDLTAAQRRAIVVGGAVEVAMTAIVLRDLARRPRTAVRGPKAAWVAACVVQPFGPLAYLALGRR
jgi:phospholipase D-like protein